MNKQKKINVYQDATEIKNILPKGKRFTLVGGCFDLLHVGHLHLLEYSATLEDILVISILSDDYVKKYKGSERPIIDQTQRAKMVASLRCVDYVYISNVSPSSQETLEILKPSRVVFNKSANSDRQQSRLERIKKFSPNTLIDFLPYYTEKEVSTSNIFEKIRKMES